LPSKLSKRIQPGFLKGEGAGGGGGGDWYLGIAESMGHVPQMSQLEN